MKAQYAIIGFDNYRIRCLIGTEAHERIHEQEILVDIKVEADCSQAMKNEEIQGTIDYILLADLCKEIAKNGCYRLMEKYISAVLDEMLGRFKLRWAWMRVKKPSALDGADYTFVEMRKEAV